ncbi:PREDICTED: uncharacterized protein LOC109373540 [Hipposideros armiger]|uniref:Uncharacterized protein LOC109373540 n=1 Tax=Hipposideros armiger TaxID=186990 RepID=A0A8B7Q2D9_HIPAR|nr:PREDICTED: uncharacterized protein LOC109373540 [Hipposideros armiger]
MGARRGRGGEESPGEAARLRPGLPTDLRRRAAQARGESAGPPGSGGRDEEDPEARRGRGPGWRNPRVCLEVAECADAGGHGGERGKSLLAAEPGHLTKWNSPPRRLSGSPSSQLRVLGLDRSRGWERVRIWYTLPLSQIKAAFLPERERHDPKDGELAVGTCHRAQRRVRPASLESGIPPRLPHSRPRGAEGSVPADCADRRLQLSPCLRPRCPESGILDWRLAAGTGTQVLTDDTSGCREDLEEGRTTRKKEPDSLDDCVEQTPNLFWTVKAAGSGMMVGK